MNNWKCKHCGAEIKYSEDVAAFFVDECKEEPICAKCFYVQSDVAPAPHQESSSIAFPPPVAPMVYAPAPQKCEHDDTEKWTKNGTIFWTYKTDFPECPFCAPKAPYSMNKLKIKHRHRYNKKLRVGLGNREIGLTWVERFYCKCGRRKI